MKKLTLIIAILFSGMLMQAQFRNTTWGMNKTEVKQSESLELTESSDDLFVYETLFLGLDTYVFYGFNNGDLISGGYVFINENTHKNDYIDDYHGINKLLTEKYGKPDSDEVNWKDDSWKYDNSRWGYAVSMGHVEYISVYEIEDLYIEHGLSAGDYSQPILHRIRYFDPEYIEESRKEDLDKL